MAVYAALMASVCLIASDLVQADDAVTPEPLPALLKAVQPTENQAEQQLLSEISGGENNPRVVEFEDALRPMYNALPKIAGGALSHQTVRYALHRLFAHRNGWYIRGLETNDARAPLSPAVLQEEWVPSYLQALIERREHELGERGTNLQELATLAASLEDLAASEATGRVTSFFNLYELSLTEMVETDEAENAIATYYIDFLLGGNLSAASSRDAEMKKARFSERYTGWLQAEEWLRDIGEVYLKSDEEGSLSFSSAKRLAIEVGQQYFKFNDVECLDLKKTLSGMETKKSGRVRLSAFYAQALYSHWRFTESADYLRTLGALDESDPDHPQVITANYLISRPNCLEASGLYAICCRTECEELMGKLEQDIGAPTASIARVAEIVESLPSDTVPAPRKLSSSLMARLQQVADGNSGEIPLHGRLFAQWMHHVYPRECPYPHAAGASTPMTPDEWMQQTGRDDSSASAEEMWRHVEGEKCRVGPTGAVKCDQPAEESEELPWSDTEELLVTVEEDLDIYVQKGAPIAPPSSLEAEVSEFVSLLPRLVFLLVVAGVLVASFRASTAKGGRRKEAPQGLLLLALFLGAYVMDLIDYAAFALAVCVGVIAFVGMHFAGKRDLTRPSSNTGDCKACV